MKIEISIENIKNVLSSVFQIQHFQSKLKSITWRDSYFWKYLLKFINYAEILQGSVSGKPVLKL